MRGRLPVSCCLPGRRAGSVAELACTGRQPAALDRSSLALMVRQKALQKQVALGARLFRRSS